MAVGFEIGVLDALIIKRLVKRAGALDRFCRANRDVEGGDFLIEGIRVSKDAVMSAVPARSNGSTSPPLLIKTCAVTKGI